MTFQEFKEIYQKIAVQEISSSTSKNPVVSVLVQTYQHKDFIRDCLDSILMQETIFNFEILLGEDGSIDGTREICIEYANKYPEKIRLFLHHPENKIRVLNNITGNFNALYNFFSARGEFIAFCEGDDYWKDPLKLQKQVSRLTLDNSLAITYHAYQEINDKGEPLPQDRILKQSFLDFGKKDLKRVTFHPLLSTICFRNDIQKSIPQEISEVINMDTFLLSVLGNYGGAAFLDNVCPSFYRRHSGGAWSSQQNEGKWKSKMLTYEKLISYYKRKEETETVIFFQNLYRKTLNQLIYFYLKKVRIYSLVQLIKINL